MKKISFIKKNGGRQKRKTDIRSMKNGSLSIAVTALFLAILAVLNLIVGELPAKYTKVDVSNNKLYTIGEQTEEIVKNLKEDVILYLVASGDNMDDTLQEMLGRYSDLSSHIKVETKDPVLYPNFVSQYTDEEISENSIIVVSDRKNKVVRYSDLYEQSLDYTTYSYKTTGFDGEGQVTSAIAYVTSDDLPIMYTVQGHGESELTDSMKNAIEKENIEIRELNLLTSESVPEDAGCLFILSPQKDFSKEEAEKVTDYLEGGGKALIVSDYTETDMPNFLSVLQNYGVQPKEGIVLEGNANHYASGNPSYLVPEIGSSEAVSGFSRNNGFVLMPLAQAVEVLSDHRDTISVENLLNTSEDAYIKKDVPNMTTLSKERTDEEGSFPLAVAVTEVYDSSETKIAYLTSSSLFNESIDQAVSGSNTEFTTNILSWICDRETSISIPAKSLEMQYLSMTASSAGFWSTFTTAVLPVLFVAAGGMIWLRRMKQ